MRYFLNWKLICSQFLYLLNPYKLICFQLWKFVFEKFLQSIVDRFFLNNLYWLFFIGCWNCYWHSLDVNFKSSMIPDNLSICSRKTWWTRLSLNVDNFSYSPFFFFYFFPINKFFLSIKKYINIFILIIILLWFFTIYKNILLINNNFSLVVEIDKDPPMSTITTWG